MKFFKFAVSALLVSTTCVPVLGVRGRRKLKKNKSSSEEEKIDTSQYLLPCLAYEAPSSKKKRSKSGEEKIGISQCPCCNEETCEYFMEFDFCEAEGYDPFNPVRNSACRYYVGDDPSVAGSLVAIDLEAFGEQFCGPNEATYQVESMIEFNGIVSGFIGSMSEFNELMVELKRGEPVSVSGGSLSLSKLGEIEMTSISGEGSRLSMSMSEFIELGEMEFGFKSHFEPGSFGYCCENIVGSCHEDAKSGCCDATRRNRRMNEISATNERFIKETDGGLHATVETEHEDGLTWLSKHVEEMQNRLEKGDTARSWDPLFRAYFANSKDIEMRCEHSENKVECKTESQTQCGIDLIKAQGEYHSKIAESLRSGGDHVIEEGHLVPKSCGGHY